MERRGKIIHKHYNQCLFFVRWIGVPLRGTYPPSRDQIRYSLYYNIRNNVNPKINQEKTMSVIKEFSPAVIEKIGYYVYLLIDPETNDVFYIGKGTGNRIFAHLNQALTSPEASDKLDKIREIQAKGLEVNHVVLRHGLTEKEAFEVEASLIDYVGIDDLTNIVQGQHSFWRGKMTISEIMALYDAPKIDIKEPVILVTVRQLFERGINDDRLYEITRGDWVLGERRNKAKYAFSVYNGIVRQVYEINNWSPVITKGQTSKIRNRWKFDGIVAQDLQHYVGGCVDNYITRGAQNPVKYVNC